MCKRNDGETVGIHLGNKIGDKLMNYSSYNSNARPLWHAEFKS